MERRLTMTVEEAAEIIGISRTSAYLCAARGELPTRRFGRRVLVLVAPFFAMLGYEHDEGSTASARGYEDDITRNQETSLRLIATAGSLDPWQRRPLGASSQHHVQPPTSQISFHQQSLPLVQQPSRSRIARSSFPQHSFERS